MTAEMTVYNNQPNTLQLWSDEARAAAEIAADLAPTPFVPSSLRVLDHGRPDVQATTANIAAALLTGRELGLSPMASMRSIDIVQGTPALRAVALRALLQAAGHEMWLVESTKTRCVMRGRRAGSDKEQEIVWTIDRAKDLGLTGKSNWRSQPQTMLVARATAELARLVAADAILGLPYTAEELEDGGEDEIPEITVNLETKPKRTAQRRLKAAPPPPLPEPGEPPIDDAGAVPHADTAPANVVDAPLPEPDEPALDEPTVGLITPAQLKMLHAVLRELDITNRDEGLAEYEAITGRAVLSSKELTVAEASTVIDALQRRAFTDPDDAG